MSPHRKRPRRERRVTRPSQENATHPPPSAKAPQRRWRAAAIVIALVAGAAFGYRTWTRDRAQPQSQRAARYNVLLVTLDTTRADRLGAYGYARARTPRFDRLAAEGVRFDHAFSPAPITLPAHASILTGLEPFAHGVRNNGNFYLSDGPETLATVFGRAGYRTAAFVSAFVLDRRYGLARGFELYDDRTEGADPRIVSLDAERRGDRTSLALAAWLERYAAGALPDPGGAQHAQSSVAAPPSGRAPFFAWLHLYDAHEPYRPPSPFREAFADSPYDGEIAFDDAIVASILDKLRQLDLLDRTLIAIIGDHGESLGDHGEETHSMFVYDAAVRVPFIVWRPGRVPPGVVEQPVRAVDLAPTVLELAGVPAIHRIQGRSLVAAIEGRESGPAPPVYAETYLPQFYMNWSPLRSLRDARWKFIEAPRPELYDLAQDPGELRNLYDGEPRRARAMHAALERLTGGSAGAMRTGALDSEAARKLASLGYIGATAESASQDAGSRSDPKDMIAVFNTLRRANHAVRERQFEEGLHLLTGVLKDHPNNAFAHLVLGSAYLGMERYGPAIEQYRRYLALVPTSAYAHQWIAICAVRLGKQDEALREASAALAIDPKFSDARVLRGGILASRGDYDGSVAELRTAVQTDPAKPLIRIDLAKVLAEAGRRADAAAEYERVLATDPDYVPALAGLGALRAQSGELGQAADLFRRAIQIDPRQDEVRWNLARVLQDQGRREDAASEYRKLAEGPGTNAAVRRAARERLRSVAGARD